MAEPPVQPVAASDPPSLPANAEDDEAQGRIGYGRYGRYTPMALALLIVIGLAAIGLADRGDDGAPAPTGQFAGRPAPDVAFTLFDGTTRRLADFRGSVVVLNFWASWCAPCKQEAPAFQAVHDDARATEAPVVVVGLGLKADMDEDARAFVRDLGLTYPLGRDTAGTDPERGAVELAFGIAPYWPTTVFVRPDGKIAAVHVGPLDVSQLNDYVATAKDA
jgi:cytochrome c biogenesis protein CcmG/thiol:disulfide interchange protein DsbE